MVISIRQLDAALAKREADVRRFQAELEIALEKNIKAEIAGCRVRLNNAEKQVKEAKKKKREALAKLSKTKR